MRQRLQHLLLGLSSSLLVLPLISFGSRPSLAAETVSLRYGPFQTSVPTADLRQYAQTGETSDRLAALLRLVSSKERESLKQGLNFKVPLNVVAVSNLVNSAPGKALLEKMTSVIVFRPESAGLVAMRGGLVMAAASKEGLGVMSFIENYPSSVIQIDVRQALSQGGDLGNLLKGFGGGMGL